MSIRPKVYIQGRDYNIHHRKMFSLKGWEIVEDPMDGDAVCWTGGDDLNPAMYNENPLPFTSFNTARDVEDTRIFNHVVRDKLLIGTCRGGQLLNVLNGGSMWQDVDNHENTIHMIKDCITEKITPVNSSHHQGMIVAPIKGEVVAYCRQSKLKKGDKKKWDIESLANCEDELDVEAIWYPETMSLCVQWHPEWGHLNSREYFFELLDRYCKEYI